MGRYAGRVDRHTSGRARAGSWRLSEHLDQERHCERGGRSTLERGGHLDKGERVRLVSRQPASRAQVTPQPQQRLRVDLPPVPLVAKHLDGLDARHALRVGAKLEGGRLHFHAGCRDDTLPPLDVPGALHVLLVRLVGAAHVGDQLAQRVPLQYRAFTLPARVPASRKNFAFFPLSALAGCPTARFRRSGSGVWLARAATSLSGRVLAAPPPKPPRAHQARRGEGLAPRAEIARPMKDLPRTERAAKWMELTGKSEKALYRRLAEC